MSAPPRIRIDLRRLLPRWAQFAVALAVVALVSALAWRTGRDRPVPGWITGWLVPVLGWTYLVLAAIALVAYARRRRGGRR